MSDQKTQDKNTEESKGCQSTLGGFVVSDGKKIYSGPIRCNSWACPDCAPRKRKQLVRRILKGEINNTEFLPYSCKFVTLTFGGDKDREKYAKINKDGSVTYDTAGMHEEMMANWNRLLTYLRKKYGKFLYFRVTEPHQSAKSFGIPHIHVLFVGRNVVPKAFGSDLVKFWEEKYKMGFGQIKKVDFNTRKHAILYLMKYLTKNNGKDGVVLSPGFRKRIFSASRFALLRIAKKVWIWSHVFITRRGLVKDNGVIVEDLPFDADGMGLWYWIQQRREWVHAERVMPLFLERHMKNILVEEIA